MATFHARRNNQMTSQQVTDMGRDQMMALQQHIRHLNMCLRQEKANYEQEKNSRAQISQELETTKEELAKQKSLKKIFIKKDKETRRELERVQTYADPETLDTLKIANQVRDTNRHKKKKALHKDYEELQVAHLISQEKFTVELQAEKDKNAALQKELDDLRASYKEVTLKCEAEVLSRQQVENLQCELENEKKAHADRVSENLLLENNLRAEMEALRSKMDQEISLAQQRTSEQELALKRELEELKTQLNNQLSVNQDLTTELTAEREKNTALQKVSHQNIQKCEDEVHTAKQQVEKLQHELERAMEAQATTELESKVLENNLRAEMEVLRSKMAQEISLAQQRTCKQELTLKRELEEQKALLNNQLSVNQDLTTELMAEREKNKALQDDSHQNRQKCEDEVHTAKQQVEKLQHELERAMEAQATTLTESKVLENNLRAEMEALRSKMAQEISLAQQRTCEQELALKRELEELRTQLNNQLSVNQDLTTELEAERLRNQPPQEEISSQEEESTEHEDENLATRPRRTSVWKRTRHLLGLRKPQRWKRPREPSSEDTSTEHLVVRGAAAGKATASSVVAGNGNWDGAGGMDQITVVRIDDSHIAEEQSHGEGKGKDGGGGEIYEVECSLPAEEVVVGEEEEDSVYVIEYSNPEEEGESYQFTMSVDRSLPPKKPIRLPAVRENARAPLPVITRPSGQRHEGKQKRKMMTEEEEEEEEEKVVSNKSVLEFGEDYDDMMDSGKQQLVCSLCPPPGRFFKRPSGLAVHLKQMHLMEGKKTFFCTSCNQSVRSQIELDAHTRRHANQDAVFTCLLCSAGAGENQMEAQTSGYRGSRLGLKKHLEKEHPGVIPRCNICNKGFKTLVSYLADQFRHVGVSPYYCAKCQIYEMTERGLSVHNKNHNKKKRQEELENQLPVVPTAADNSATDDSDF
ncbi:hypothetical protein INR49_012181 [Caranx melampygus]|nr:hypothetical protein INR49_012181 [Caranx melampygus]